MAFVIKDSFTVTPNTDSAISNTLNVWLAQTFLVTDDYNIGGIALYCNREDASSDGTIRIALRNAKEIGGKWYPTGSDLIYVEIDETSLGLYPPIWREFEFNTEYPVVNGNRYAFVVSVSGATSDWSFRWWGRFETGLYSDGWLLQNFGGDGGESWDFIYDTEDIIFRILAIGPDKATNPDPEHEATDVDFSDRVLSWTNGDGTNSWKLYIGDAPDNLTFIANGAAAYYYLNDSQRALFKATCYWRVDCINDDGTTAGDVWNFTCAAPGKATNPAPGDAATDININFGVLTWDAPV